MAIHSYKDLIVWQKAKDLAVLVYELTEEFPRSELYGLTSQMRRAVISIPSNIAEGRRRGHKKEFLHFLLNAYGSGAELETQIEIAKQLKNLKELNYNKIDILFIQYVVFWRMLIQGTISIYHIHKKCNRRCK
jgi:four helix bundle protein